MKKVQDRYQNDIFNWVNNKYTALSLLQPPHKPSNWLKELFFQSLPSQKLSLSHLILIDCHPETRELKLSIGTKVSQSLKHPSLSKIVLRKRQNCFFASAIKKSRARNWAERQFVKFNHFSVDIHRPRKAAVVSDTFQSLLHPCFVLSGI